MMRYAKRAAMNVRELDKGHSENRLAQELDLQQSAGHRALKTPARLTKTDCESCKFADIALDVEPPKAEMKDVLVREALETWDGSRGHAYAITRLLLTGVSLRTYGATHAVRPKKLT